MKARNRVRTKGSVAAMALAASLVACQTTEPVVLFEDVKEAPELFAEGEEELEGTWVLGVYRYVNYARAIEVFQAIIDNYPYSEYAVEAELRIADAYFEDGQYEEALSYYRDFGELHPEHPKVPYTIFRSALCHEQQVEHIQRDQTATKSALVFLDRLLVRYPYSQYAEEAEPLWRELQVHLAESDEAVADFYKDRQEFEAAAERYRSLLNDHPGLGLDDRVLYKLGECYAELRRTDEADRIYRTLVVHYAKSPFAYKAKQRLAANLRSAR